MWEIIVDILAVIGGITVASTAVFIIYISWMEHKDKFRDEEEGEEE